MAERRGPTIHERWAHLRFSVIGQLLAAPPERGQLHVELEQLASRKWTHPITGGSVQFGISTIERWYYQARNGGADPVGVLRKKIRKDSGRQVIGDALRKALIAQHAAVVSHARPPADSHLISPVALVRISHSGVR